MRAEVGSDWQLWDQELVVGEADWKHAVEELGAVKFVKSKPGVFIVEPVWGWQLSHTGIDQGRVW